MIREIRELSGHEHFMRGFPFKDLAFSAAHHAVVVLVAGQEECRALILRSTQDILEDICLERITRTDLEQLSVTIPGAGMRGATLVSTEANDRGMQVSRRREHLARVLYKLWTDVVKPVLHHLRFKVSIRVVIDSEHVG
jgi:hypothetical protein